MAAFSLPEVMFAVAILAIMFLANLSAISLTRVQMAKDKQQAIMLDFALHYLELVRSMAFVDIRQNVAVNPLYSGANGGVQIMIPASSAWSSLNTTNYRTFHPELTWLLSQNPEISVNVNTQLTAGVIKNKSVVLQLRWDPALNKGSKQTVRMDLVRAADL
ncbi:MAG: prepilin-type N-terminal cleavage/methylation domain-containing protein [Verrucomicrobia bacterium]|nr:prepilin-type N-terminal cleavage/methylation domain-containing protein [Verrucomicrobiota bacterium]